jgi:hypothetical protein
MALLFCSLNYELGNAFTNIGDAKVGRMQAVARMLAIRRKIGESNASTAEEPDRLTGIHADP